MSLRAILCCNTASRGACNRFYSRPCSRIRKGNGPVFSRACWWNGFWLIVCPCGLDYNCTSSSGTPRPRVSDRPAKKVKKRQRGDAESAENLQTRGRLPGGSGIDQGTDERSSQSSGAFERRDGLLREHGDCTGTPGGVKHRVAPRQLRPAHRAA